MIRKTTLIGVLAILIGIIASLSATVFVTLIKNAYQWLHFDRHWQSAFQSPILEIVILILIPAVGGLLVGLMCCSFSDHRPLTLVDSIRSAQSMRFVTPFKQSLITALAGVVSLSSGASLGQYGPVAHLGSAMGLAIRNLTGSTVFTPAMALGCGVAAAISTVFNAPIAGLVFAHEVILRHYSLRAFAPITVASVMGYLLTNYVWHDPAMFPVDNHAPINVSEFIVFIAIGVFGAFLAALLIKLVIWFSGVAAQMAVKPVFKPAMAGLALGVTGLWLPEIMGIGDAVAIEVLAGEGTATSFMVVILIFKVLATAVCLGFGMAGGVFSPAIFIGLMLGAIVGNVVEPLFGASYSSIVPYVVCGMVAVASPVVGAPLTSILIIFELSRNYDLAVAAMISVVFANLVGYQIVGRSLFDIQLKNSGFDLGEGRESVILSSRSIAGFISDKMVVIEQQLSVQELKTKLLKQQLNSAFVVDSSGKLKGEITLFNVSVLEGSADLENESCLAHCKFPKICLRPETTIWQALKKVQDFVGECIPVIDGDNRLLGVVYEASIVKAYMQTQKNLRQDENGVD